MNDPFEPLLPDLTQSTRFQRTPSPASAPASGAGFESLHPVGTAPGSPPPAAHERLPVVTFKRDGDRVTRIQVRCSCGEMVELDCVY